MRSIGKILVKYIGTLFCLVVVGYGLLVAVYALPVNRISKNVEKSVPIFAAEGGYPSLAAASVLDNFMDAMMLLNAKQEQSESIVEEALLVRRLDVEGKNPAETLVAFYSGEKAEFRVTSYARYWHGCLIYLKPLLSLVSLKHIRLLLIFLQFTLLMATVYLVVSKRKKHAMLPLFAAMALLNPETSAISLQFTPVFVLTFVQMVLILRNDERYETDAGRWPYHFFIVGCLISYFDLLTYPAVSFGLPMAYLLSQYKGSIKESLRQFLLSGLAWCSGYVLFWASKWALATALTNENVIANAISALRFRTGMSVAETTFHLWEPIWRNVSFGKYALLVTLVIFLYLIVKGWHRKRIHWNPQILTLLPVGVIPFFWYGMASNHSYIHPFFTYKELAIFVYVLIAIGELLTEEKEKV